MPWQPPPPHDAPLSAQGPATPVPTVPAWLTVTPTPAPPPFVPYVPAVPIAAPTRPLQAPVWERQAEEPPVVWAAFQGWLAPGGGGTTPGRAGGPVPGVNGNWAEAGARVAESSRAALEAMAYEWQWEARRAAQDAHGARKTPTAEARSQRAAARRLQALATDLAEAELTKLFEECKATPAMRLTVKELIALFGRIGSIEVMRERAGILEALSAGANNGAPAVNWDAFTDDELEAFRKLTDKAGV